MGKISPISIKYTIYADFIAEGVVEKPDVIGAIFGQTEGLLGHELELRDLQKNGKIGRIDVTLETSDSKTHGKIEIPTALDKSETSIIAAALETIERIGPCDAKVKVSKIEDVRGSKREYVVARAKSLLEELSKISPDTKEIELAVTTSVKKGKIQEYGEELLPGGPDLNKNELIVVEGRADVLNLLRYGINNVIAMNGTSMPKTIQDLSKTKTLTLFVDGDRGGQLMIKDAVSSTDIKFVAQAPAGKEVEELSGKELLACLRAKKSIEEFIKKKQARQQAQTRIRPRPKFKRRARSRFEAGQSQRQGQWREAQQRQQPQKPLKAVTELSEEDRAALQKILYDLSGTRGACLFDNKLAVIRKIPASEIITALRNPRKAVYAIVLDGVATAAVIRAAEKANVQHLVARNFELLSRTAVNLVSL